MEIMKILYIVLAMLVSSTSFGQIEQNINKTSGTISNPITQIDSIRFNTTTNQMEIIRTNGNIENHDISDIINVTFSGQLQGSPASCGASNLHNPNLTYGSMTDQDGNLYKTIIIGTQEWMAENLKASHYGNGDLIPLETDPATWSSLNTGATCWYNNDSAAYDCPYGKLYNWYVTADSRNVCPTGWHVPEIGEWYMLSMQLDTAADTSCVACTHSFIAGGKMKSVGNYFWISPNYNADNSSGFSGLPCGARSYLNGIFGLIGYNSGWWTSTELNLGDARLLSLTYNNGNISGGANPKGNGFSIRCVRD
jgi:uncharacterized protein (TIGR02145 family)